MSKAKITRPTALTTRRPDPCDHNELSDPRFTAVLVPRRLRSLHVDPRVLLGSLALAAAAGGAFAGCHPTGTAVADPIETAAFAAAFTLALSQANRGVWLVVGVTATLLSRGWLLVPALMTVLVAFSGAFSEKARRSIGALVGALAVQVVLRWPAQFFHGFPSAVAAALTVIVGASAWARSSSLLRRRAAIVVGGLAAAGLVLSLPLVALALGTRSDVLQGESSGRAAIADVGGASTGVVSDELATASADTASAASSLDQWFAAGARLVPIVAQHQRFLVGALRSVASVAVIAKREIPTLDYKNLGYHDGQINLAHLEGAAGPLRLLGRQLQISERQLSTLRSSWLVAPLQDRARSYQRQLQSAAHSVQLGARAAQVLPAMLGRSGPRSYLVLFMTPSESRGYDGLIGGYGVLSAQDGRVRLTSSNPIGDLATALPPGGAKLSGVPGYLRRYGAFDPGEFPQDVTYSPDLPTDAKVFDEIYAQAGGGPVDGVLAVDPIGLAALLELTGPVDVPGLPFPLTSANAAQVLLKEQYTLFDAGGNPESPLRIDFLQTALQVSFDALVDSSLPSPKEVAAVLDPAVRAGRISFMSFHGDEEHFLEALGTTGTFPAASGENVLAVTSQNTDNNKIDAYLHTSVTDNVTVDPGNGDIQSTVRVALTNDAPASGLPPIVIDDFADPAVPAGTNRTWLSVYSPLALDHVTVDGNRAAMSVTRELGVWVYSTYVDIPSKSTTTVQVELDGRVDPGSSLRLAVRLQPSANKEQAEIKVNAVGPWTLTGGKSGVWRLGNAMRQDRTFRFASS